MAYAFPKAKGTQLPIQVDLGDGSPEEQLRVLMQKVQAGEVDTKSAADIANVARVWLDSQVGPLVQELKGLIEHAKLSSATDIEIVE